MDNETNTTNPTSSTTQGGAGSSTPSSAPQSGTPDNQLLMGVLAYVSILVLIPLLTEKNDPFVRYHVRQGLVLLVIEVALWVLGMFMMWMLPLFAILRLLNLGCIVLSVIGIINVVNKKQAPVPLVGQFASHFNNV